MFTIGLFALWLILNGRITLELVLIGIVLSLLLSKVFGLVKEITAGYLPFITPLVYIVQAETVGRSYAS